MRLRLIAELRLGRATKRMEPLLAVMPKAKQKHSKRVAKHLNKAGVGKIGVYAGLLHDYLERGGDPETLSQHIDELGLPTEIVTVVHSLSDDEKYDTDDSPNQPLAHMQSVLQTIDDEDLRNILVLAKLADRLDNLQKRARRRISKRYAAKSRELVTWLASQYTGKNKPFRKLWSRLERFI